MDVKRISHLKCFDKCNFEIVIYLVHSSLPAAIIITPIWIVKVDVVIPVFWVSMRLRLSVTYSLVLYHCACLYKQPRLYKRARLYKQPRLFHNFMSQFFFFFVSYTSFKKTFHFHDSLKIRSNHVLIQTYSL